MILQLNSRFYFLSLSIVSVCPSLPENGRIQEKGSEIMQMIPVSSSNLASIGYENGVLYITFHHGGTYWYRGVPESVYHGLMNASSHGKYFHAFIKNVYPYGKC